MMLHRMAFSYLVGWLHCILITALQKLIYVIRVVQNLPFFPRLVCQILSLTDKHNISLIPTYIPSHLNVEASYLSWGHLLPEWQLLPHIANMAFNLWGLSEVDLLVYSDSTLCQHYYSLETPLPPGGLGVECFQLLLDISGKLCVSSSCTSSSSSVQVSGGSCHRSILTFDSGGNTLDGGSLAPYRSQHVGRHSSALSCHQRLHCWCIGRQYAQGSAISAFNPWLFRDMCCAYRGSLPPCVRVGAAWKSTPKVYQLCWKRWEGYCAQEGGQKIPYLPLNQLNF